MARRGETGARRRCITDYKGHHHHHHQRRHNYPQTPCGYLPHPRTEWPKKYAHWLPIHTECTRLGTNLSTPHESNRRPANVRWPVGLIHRATHPLYYASRAQVVSWCSAWPCRYAFVCIPRSSSPPKNGGLAINRRECVQGEPRHSRTQSSDRSVNEPSLGQHAAQYPSLE